MFLWLKPSARRTFSLIADVKTAYLKNRKLKDETHPRLFPHDLSAGCRSEKAGILFWQDPDVSAC